MAPVVDRSSHTRRNSKGHASVQEPHNTLALYFSEMSDGKLLDADSESRLADTLREQEELLWSELFSAPSLVPAVSAKLADLLGDATPSFRALRSAATRCRNKPSPGSARSLTRASNKLAPKLRSADPDRKVFDELSEWLTASLDEDSIDAAFRPCDRDELAALCQRLSTRRRDAERTRNRFVEANLGLVVSVARRYQFSGMSLADLIQEGNLGLIKAVSPFDGRKGFRFSTYATWWIRHAVGRSVADKSRTVRVPVHIIETNQKLRAMRRELERSLGREPTRQELAEAADMSLEKLETTMQAASGGSTSLDEQISDDNDRARLEVFIPVDDESAHDRLARHALGRRASHAMEQLAPLEVEILHRRFGLAGRTATTLQDIANSIGKSRERIRQIQEKALSKLRKSLVAEHAV
jgi:RNA polymerase primary sigma factor